MCFTARTRAFNKWQREHGHKRTVTVWKHLYDSGAKSLRSRYHEHKRWLPGEHIERNCWGQVPDGKVCASGFYVYMERPTEELKYLLVAFRVRPRDVMAVSSGTKQVLLCRRLTLSQQAIDEARKRHDRYWEKTLGLNTEVPF